MYGGTLRDGYSHDTSTTISTNANGGNLGNHGTTNIYGGTIKDGIGGQGGNIYNSGTLNIYGGEILNGIAGYTKGTDGELVKCLNTWRCGGNIYSYGKVNIYGGTISGGHALNGGGNIYNSANNGVVIDGKDEAVVIKDGYAEAMGGNIYGDNVATYIINNAIIKDGKVINTTGGEGDGANIFSKGPKLEIRNTTISGGTSSTHSSVYYRGLSAVIENSTITMVDSFNASQKHKGCLFFLNNGTTSTPAVTIKDSTIGEIYVGAVTSMTIDGKCLFGTETQNGMYIASASMGELITLGADFSAESKIYVQSGADTTVAANGAAKIDCFVEKNSTETEAWKLEAEGQKLVLRKDVSSNHKHCDCGLNDCTATGHTCDATQKWQEWTSTTTLPAESGYYFLANDITVTATAYPQNDADVHICFNGKKVTSNIERAISQYSNSVWHTGVKYTFTDCAETAGTLATTKQNHTNQGALIWLTQANSQINLYRVTLTAENGAYVFKNSGGLICFGGTGSVMNIYSGTISNGRVQSGTGTEYAQGGNIAIGGNATLNIYGGTITGGTMTNGGAWGCGGNIAQTDTSTINMYGGTVSNGKLTTVATGYGTGANIAIVGTFNMYGGTVTGAQASGAAGGNIWADMNSTVVLKAGTISNGVANTGAGLYTKSTKAAALTIDGTIEFTGNQTPAGKESDLYFNTASSKLTLGTNFAVRTGDPIAVGAFGEMTFTTNAGSAEDFTATEADYEITKNGDGTLKYGRKPLEVHQHIADTNAKIHASTEDGVVWKDLNAEL